MDTPFFVEIPSGNPWGFTADEGRLMDVLETHTDVPGEDPTGAYLGVNAIAPRWAGYRRRRWRVFQRFLLADPAVAGLVIDVAGFFPAKDFPEPPGHDDGTGASLRGNAAHGLRRMLERLESGALRPEALLAASDHALCRPAEAGRPAPI